MFSATPLVTALLKTLFTLRNGYLSSHFVKPSISLFFFNFQAAVVPFLPPVHQLPHSSLTSGSATIHHPCCHSRSRHHHLSSSFTTAAASLLRPTAHHCLSGCTAAVASLLRTIAPTTGHLHLLPRSSAAITAVYCRREVRFQPKSFALF